MNKEFKFFIDFDGTITKKDVGDALFREFSDRDKVNLIIADLLSGKISAKECWLILCNAIIKFNRDEIDRFIDSVEIDNSFHLFFKYCKENNFDVFVVSDGFDYYINRIFNRENLNDIKVFSNNLEITADRFIPAFPYEDEGCRTSANCKQNHVINNSSDDDYTFYIGNGNSDKIPSQYCDFIFAKDSLLKFCERERVTYFPYKSFSDIVKKLEELKNKKRLKKRHQAELKRRERYMIE